MTAASPRAPNSVSNQQPPTPIDHLLLDKNTPAPTPTDQHDSKSITASPYVQPTPSVEPSPSAEAMQLSVGPGSVPQPPSVERCTPTIPQQPQQQHQQQQQQQCGLITVKKFETNHQAILDQKSFIPSISANDGIIARSSNNTNSGCGVISTNRVSNSAVLSDYYKLYKPPKLTIRDIEKVANDDCLVLDSLYDFTLRDAW